MSDSKTPKPETKGIVICFQIYWILLQKLPLLYLWDLGYRNHVKVNVLGSSYGTEVVYYKSTGSKGKLRKLTVKITMKTRVKM